MTNIIDDIRQAIEKKEITAVDLKTKAIGRYPYNIEALQDLLKGLQENTQRLTSFINTLEEERNTLENQKEEETTTPAMLEVFTRMAWLCESLEYHHRADVSDPLQEVTQWINDLIKHHSKKKG